MFGVGGSAFLVIMLSAVIVAAGDSRRMGFDKLLAPIAGKPVIAHTLRAFECAKSVNGIIVVARADRRDEIEKTVGDENLTKVQSVIPGGKRRQDSVRAGLDALESGAQYVAVHDAARPLITSEQIERVFEQSVRFGAAALAEPINDTLKRANTDLLVTGSADRDQVYAMQTPQIFERQLIEQAYRAVYADDVSVTDEVSAVERLGRKVMLVLSDDFNFKITYPRDLPLAEVVLERRENPPLR
jgi:2-C-methyl-D-erythritol 4-phosphate cytidylyltransferase